MKNHTNFPSKKRILCVEDELSMGEMLDGMKLTMRMMVKIIYRLLKFVWPDVLIANEQYSNITNMINTQNTKLVIFEEKEVRRVWHGETWYFSVSDIVQILTDSNDVKQYIKKMRTRDPELSVN